MILSVKEKLEQLQAEEELARKQAEEEEARKKEVLNTRYHEEYPERRKYQAILLEELRELGVVAMVEEVVEKPIEPIMDPEVRLNPQTLTPIATKPWPTMERLKEIEELNRPRRWSADLPLPVLSDKGIWDDALHIRLRKNPEFLFSHRLATDEDWRCADRVDIAYFIFREGRILEIAGAEVTFNGVISTEDEAQRTEVLETALARALLHPKPGEERFRPPHEWHDMRMRASG